ncbi:MAG TPA: hypothetical protein ENF43_03190 [Thermoplasmatales archaeon]|nr:hypothetical protein [Thermoplasmatales archaeon]
MSRDLFYGREFIKDKKELILERISTGIPKLDELLQGGIPKNSVTLVSGPPGSGKTILCYHFIDEGIKNGERCLYISVDQSVKSLLMHAYSAGFDFLPAIEKGLLKVFHVDVESANAYTEIEEETMSGSFSRIVVDSLSPFADTPLVFTSDVDFEKAPILDKLSSYPSDSRPVIRSHVRRIFEFLHEVSATSMLTSELIDHSNGLSRDTVSEFLADGVILMGVDPMMDRRKLTIWKMRGTKHTLKPQDVMITDGGLMFK